MPPIGSECHTFTIVARCEREGLLGICLTSSPLSVGARCPFIKPGVGAVSTQAYTDPALGPLALDLLERGHAPDAVLEQLRANDTWSSYRQIGIVDKNGVSAVFTGEDNLDWKGAIARPNLVAMGNYLTGPAVVDDMAEAFEASAAEMLEERLLLALEAGRNAGGEKGGHLSSALIVFGRDSYARTDLRVDRFPRSETQGDAVDELRRTWNEYRPAVRYYELRPQNPLLPPWREWVGENA
jgi:uncharacterized Ntn-hydrolase superfamily protein